MLEYIKAEANHTLTENGAAAHMTTGSHCLDLFATVGALRSAEEQSVLDRFQWAYAENPDLAMKILFYGRDVRGGLGERRVFRTCFRWLAGSKPASVRKNLALVAEFGRWDDLLCLLGTACENDALELIRTQLHKDMMSMEEGEDVSLLAKWLPSVNASSRETVKMAKQIARYLGMDDRTYRRTLVALREKLSILENNLREKDYTFDYSKQPSKAMFKYRKAFCRNDPDRYSAYLQKVAQGEATLHANTLMPYELVQPYLTGWRGGKWNGYMRQITEEEEAALNATWASLTNLGTKENALAVIDTSGSMYCFGQPMPGAVALSLGMYFAEHNTGAFHGHFIEFSDRPQLIALKGETFADRLRYAASFSRVANTNLEAVFDLVLKAAVRNRVPQEEMPEALYVISDMEFDCCISNGGNTVFENAKAKFAARGYLLPRVVFWNVQSRNVQQPVTMNEQGVMLVSGCTPRIFAMLSSGTVSPMTYMLEILGAERYAAIAA